MGDPVCLTRDILFYEKGRNGYGDPFQCTHMLNWGIYLFILKITGIKVELLQLHEPVSCCCKSIPFVSDPALVFDFLISI